MSTTTATKTTAPKPATRTPAKPVTTPKGKAAPKASTQPKAAAPVKKVAPKETPATPEPKTLLEALTTGQATLVKIRANGTVRSLPYYAKGTEVRETAMAVDARRTAGDTIEKIAEEMKVSVATIRRYVTGLALAHEVEAGKHDAAWAKGERNVVVHRVAVKTA